MSEALFYEKPVLLNRDVHRHRRIAARSGFAFARGANSLPLACAEFNEACKAYAIVFTRETGGKITPVVMLGLRERENLFVDAQGRWTAGYVPAFVRRYPFVLAELPDRQMGVCIDEAHAGLNETEGEALFDADGRDTPFLTGALDFLNRYQIEHMRTAEFCQRLTGAGLLTPMNAQADLADGSRLLVSDFLVVDEKQLMALPDAKALALFRAGDLHLISLHLASLSNMQRLTDKLAEKKRSMAPAPRPLDPVPDPQPGPG
ncbi:MAG: SapC family protein [Burkholderiaceae bacterium]|nr:SapC family protein [Burkholderiaceae bacterium]